MSHIGVKSRVFAVVNINHPSIARSVYIRTESKVKLTVCRDNRIYSEDSDGETFDATKYAQRVTQEYRKLNPDMKFGATVTVEIFP